jgi:hypothetical protein
MFSLTPKVKPSAVNVPTIASLDDAEIHGPFSGFAVTMRSFPFGIVSVADPFSAIAPVAEIDV